MENLRFRDIPSLQYLGSSQRYQVYFLDIQRCDPRDLEWIIERCERVESAVWRPSENFSEYFQRQSSLYFAVADDEIVGFALFEITIRNASLVVNASECMVLSEHQGYRLPNLLTSVLVSHVRDTNRKNKIVPYKDVIFMCLTVNFKMMAAFKRYNFLVSSDIFKKCATIERVAIEYLKEEEISQLNSEEPFFVKAAFPNSLKEAPRMALPSFVPLEFDLQRGDGLLYVCKIRRYYLLGLVSKLIQIQHSFKLSKDVRPKVFSVKRPKKRINHHLSFQYSDVLKNEIHLSRKRLADLHS